MHLRQTCRPWVHTMSGRLLLLCRMPTQRLEESQGGVQKGCSPSTIDGCDESNASRTGGGACVCSKPAQARVVRDCGRRAGAGTSASASAGPGSGGEKSSSDDFCQQQKRWSHACRCSRRDATSANARRSNDVAWQEGPATTVWRRRWRHPTARLARAGKAALRRREDAKTSRWRPCSWV